MDTRRGPRAEARSCAVLADRISLKEIEDILRMPLFIKDDTTAALVAELAQKRGVSKTDAVRLAVAAELERGTPSLMERLEAFWAAHPLGPPTGEPADKAFFDELSGDL
jgi:antitoxin VapB